MGGRRGQDRGRLDRHALSPPAPGRTAPDPPGADVAPPARVRRSLAGGPDRDRARPGHRLGPPAPHRELHGPRRGDARRPGPASSASRTSSVARLLEAACRPRGCRRGRRGAPGPAQRLPRVELLRALARTDDSRPDLGRHRLGRAQPPGARALRRRLRRGQRAPGPPAPARRAGPHLGPAPGRRPRRDGDAQCERPGRGHPPRPLFSVFVGYETIRGASASSRTGPSLPLGSGCPGWTRPTSSGPSSPWGAGST